MRSFIIAMVLLGAMLGGIAGNYIYINEVSEQMLERLDAMPNVLEGDCSPQAAEIVEFWESHAPTVGLSVGYTVTDRVSEQAVTLSTCAACHDLYGYQTALALLRDAVGDMRRLEAFSLENLL